MAATENRELFSRCNISEDVIRRITRRIIQKTPSWADVSSPSAARKNDNKTESGNTRTALSRSNNKRLSAPSITVSHCNNKNKACLERLLLSVPLDNDVARFSDNEASTSVRGLPLYSENYESSFCLPSSGYKSDSEGRGRSKYRIRTCNSANPSPSQSPERPAQRASVRRTQSLTAPGDTARITNQIQQRLRKESLEADKKANTSAVNKLKQLGFKGFNTTSSSSKPARTDNSQQQQQQQQNSTALKSRSSNAIADIEKDTSNKNSSSNSSRDNLRTKTNAVLRSRSFNSIDSDSIRNRFRPSKTTSQDTTSSQSSTSAANPTLRQSATSAFEQVRQHFGPDQWRKRTNSNSSAPETSNTSNNNIRSSSFNSLHDTWESRKAFEKFEKKGIVQQRNDNGNNLTFNASANSRPPQASTRGVGEKNSFSDVDTSTDLISRRRERRRLKREIYSQRLSSDRSDSETETEDNYFVRQALERSQRRTRTQSTARRQHKQRPNSDDSNDENNNETASDKTLDSGVFELAVSSFSENINKLSKKYNSDEFLNAEVADCLSPKSGYSSASESLAESLAESTTTFCDSGDETTTPRGLLLLGSEMDRKKRAANSRFKFKPDNKTNVKTAVLNSTRAKNISAAGTANPGSTPSSSTTMSPSTTTTSNNKQSNDAKKDLKQRTKHVNQPQPQPPQQQQQTAPPKAATTKDTVQRTNSTRNKSPTKPTQTGTPQSKTTKSLSKENSPSKHSNSSETGVSSSNKVISNPSKASKDKLLSVVDKEQSSNVSVKDNVEREGSDTIRENKKSIESPLKSSSKTQEKSHSNSNNNANSITDSNNKITKKGSLKQLPKEKVDTVSPPARKNGIIGHKPVAKAETSENVKVPPPKATENVNTTTTTTNVEKPSPKNGLINNKVELQQKPTTSHHQNCFTPIDQNHKKVSKSSSLSPPSNSKPKRRISHHGCLSSDSEPSRSNTPTKSRRVSHAGCFTPVDKSSDSDNSRSNTPTKPRRTSHHNCFKPVGSDSDSNSRSSTPTRAPKERRKSHHNCCVPSPNPADVQQSLQRQQKQKQQHHEQSTKNSTQQKKSNHTNNKEVNEADQQTMSDNNNTATTTDQAAAKQKLQQPTETRNSANNTSRKGVIVGGPAQRKDEIKPKLARTCVSPTLNKSLEIEINTNTKQLTSIDERTIYVVTSSDEKNNTTLLITSNQLATDSNSDDDDGSSKQSQSTTNVYNNQQQLHNEQHTSTTTQDEQQTTTNSMATDYSSTTTTHQQQKHKSKQQNNLKFAIDHRRSSISEESDKHKLKKRGDSVELVLLNLDNNNTSINIKTDDETTTNLSRAGYSSGGKAKVPLPTPTTATTVTNRKNNNNNEKGVQCLLLSGDSKLSGKIVSVSDTSKQITINEDILQELGTDILQDIQFTYPEYLITPEQRQKLEQTIQEQQQLVGESSEDDDIDSEGEEGQDETDSTVLVLGATTNTSTNSNNNKTSTKRFEKQRVKSQKLQMENTRLQQLLYEVEKARAGTMKALLHVNTMLNKVQGDNTQLEGDLEVCGQEKKLMEDNLKEYSAKELASIDSIGGGGKKGQSLSIVIDQWKKEKKELMSQLNKFKGKSEDGEKASSRLRVQYKKVKEQLEHSNNAFTMTLKNNLDATKRMEAELKSSLDEKQEMYKKLNEGNKFKREIEALKNEMEELKAANEELQDENDNLGQKVKHLEKQKKQLLQEEEELHEQVAHSQEIIEKLTDVEDELKEQLDAEIKDKEYLQEMLDETGNILYQLKNNEQKLLKDKDILLDDLEQEVEEKHSLQTTLEVTIDEHKEIVGKLHSMTNVHTTVKESLQQANKKEKNYQEQIEALTKTNHILHYTLEKEKEERMDLQEMFDIIESDHKKFKNETLSRIKDMESTIDDLRFENHHLKQAKEELEKKCAELQATLEQEEEESGDLRQKLTRVEQLKKSIENQLESLQNSSEQIEQTKTDLQKSCNELEVDLRMSKQKVEKLTNALEAADKSLDKSNKELNETKLKLEEYRNDYDDLQSKNRERTKRLRDLEKTNESLSEQKERYLNRMNYYENETKELRKTVNEQTEEIGTLRIESQRFARERDTHKRNCEMSVHDFEVHKTKCTETLKKLKEEIIELSNKIVEKDRLAMKQKEHFQDQMENTQNDLQLLRSMLDNNIKSGIKKARRISEASDSGSEKLDLGVLRNSHDKFRDEFQSHVDKLENLLKDTGDSSDTVTVVQSPMSKIKLEELKQLRNEMFEMQSELTIIRNKFANVSAEITSLKLGTPTTSNSRYSKQSSDEKLLALEDELSKLNDLITKIECRHQAVMSQNAILLQRTLTEDDRTAKDLVKKFQVISLEGENKQLKTLLGILKKKYDFDENELADELKQIGQDRLDGNGLIMNGNNNNNNNNSEEYPSDEDGDIPKSLPRRVGSRLDRNLPQRTLSARRAQRNYSFMNEMVNSPDGHSPRTSYSRGELNQRSSGASSYSSDDDDYKPTTNRLKRNNTLPSRSRRPRT